MHRVFQDHLRLHPARAFPWATAMAKKKKTKKATGAQVAPTSQDPEKASLRGSNGGKGGKKAPAAAKYGPTSSSQPRDRPGSRGHKSSGRSNGASQQAPAKKKAQSATQSSDAATIAAMHAVPGHVMDPNEGKPKPAKPAARPGSTKKRMRTAVWIGLGCCGCCGLLLMLLMMLRAGS